MENSRGEGISGVKGKSRKFLHFQEKPEEIAEILKTFFRNRWNRRGSVAR